MATSIPNFRDVASAVPGSAPALRQGVLLRGAVPRADDHVGTAFEWPPRLVVDLRSAREIEPTHPLNGPDTSVVHAPLLADLEPGQASRSSLGDLYVLMVKASAHELVRVAQAVAATEGPAYVHCAAGKDRTGVAVALMLRLAGVSRADVMADYLASNDHLDAIDARLRPPGQQGPTLYGPRRLMVSADLLDAVMDVWDSHTGGTAGWFEASGGTVDAMSRLRRRLVS
jgi:protein-tyrosine phosphatase